MLRWRWIGLDIKEKGVSDDGVVSKFVACDGALFDEVSDEVVVPEKVSLEDIAARNAKGYDDVLSGARVCVLGAGGLGSNVCNMLARCCVGFIRVVDFDVVEASNLNRQLYFVDHVGRPKVEVLKEVLHSINPFVEVEALVERVDEDNVVDFVRDCDVVVEAFDRAEMKAMVVNRVLEAFEDKVVVSGSGMAGVGSGNDIRTSKVMDRLYLCGDYVSDFEECDGIMAPRVMLVAAHQANTVLRLILGAEK